MSRPRITAEPRDGGFLASTGMFYTASEWIARERRREGWRRSKRRQRMDPEKRRRMDEMNARYQRSESGRATRRQWLSERARQEHDRFERECQDKFGSMTDEEIQLRILAREVELRQMRHVLRGRDMDRRMRSAA